MPGPLFTSPQPQKRAIAVGDFLFLKRAGNQNLQVMEPNDYVVAGIVEGKKISGVYLGGETTLLANFKVTDKITFNEN